MDALIYFINDPSVLVCSEIGILPQAKAEQPSINRTPEAALDAGAGIPQSLTKRNVSQPLPLQKPSLKDNKNLSLVLCKSN